MAGQDVISTRLEITGEADYRQKLKQIATQMRQVNSESKVTEATFGKADRSVAKLTQTYAQMEKRLSLQSQKLKAIGAEYERVVNLEGENSDSARKLAVEYNRTSAEVIRLEKQMEELNNEITSHSSGWDKAIKSAEAIQTKYAKLGNTMQSVGKKITGVTLAASSAIIGTSAKAYMDLADGMAVVYTIADKAQVPMEQMMTATIAASNEIGTAATELANAEYQAISAGVETAEAVDFVTVAAKGAAAGLSDVTTVVDASTSVINAWGYAWSDATDIMDKMLVAQQYGKTTVDEISQSIGNLTGLAPQLNMGFEEILAATAALTKNGVATSQTMTGLRGVLSAILKPSSEAAKLAEELGLEFNAAAMQSKGFAGFLEDVLEKTDGNSEQLAVLFGQVEGLSAVMSLAGSAAGDFSAALTELDNSAGTLDAQFAQRMDSPAARLERAMNRMRNAAISFGQTLAPYIDIAAGSIEKLGEVLGNLSGEQQMALVKTAAWVAGIGGAIAVTGKLLTSLKALATAGKLIFSGPVGWVVGGALAVGGLTAAMAKLADTTRDVDEVWEEVQGKFDDQMARDVAMIIGAEIDTSPALESFDAAIKAMSENIMAKLTDGLPDDQATVSALKTEVSEKFKTLTNAVEQQLADDLAAVNPDSADYEAQTAAIITEAETTKTELAALEQEYYAFIDTYAGKSAATVKAHVDELDTLDEKVLKLTADIEAYNREQQSAGAHSFEVVEAGITTDTNTIAEAWQHAYQTYKLGLQKFESQRDADIAALNARYASGDISRETFGEEAERIGLQYEVDQETIKETWIKNANALLGGMKEAFAAVDPESAGIIDEIKRLFDIEDMLTAFLESPDAYGDLESLPDPLEQYLLQKVAEMPGRDINYLRDVISGRIADAGLFTAINEEIESQIISIQETLPDNPLMEILNAIFSSEAGTALGVDTSNLESVMSAAAGELSIAATEGYTSGIEDNQTEINNAMTGMIQGGVDAARNAQDSHSPSRVYRNLGHDAIDGMVLGVQDRRGKLIAVMREIARAAVNAAREELDIHSPSRVMYDVGMQTAQGYINAINAQVAAVERSMQRLAAPRTLNMAPGASYQAGYSRGGENVVNNVNVHYSAPYGRKEALQFGNSLAKGITDAQKAYGG